MKFIVYGIGKTFQKNVHKIDMNNVLGFIDVSFGEQDKLYMDKDVITLNLIKTYDFNYIIVFTDEYFNEIAENLIWNYSVNANKIINYANFFAITSHEYRKRVARGISKYISSYDIKNVLDIGAFIGHTEFWAKKCFVTLDCLLMEEKPDIHSFYYNLYNNIYKDAKLLKKGYYDLIFLFNTEFDLCIEHIKFLKSFGNNIFFPIRIGNEERYKKFFGDEFDILNIDGMLFGVVYKFKKLKIYEVTHKFFTGPNDDIYVPIYAGSYKGGLDSYIHDDTGDNISQYNAEINEATAMYWIWKNDNNEYVGINHYRRFFQSEINPFCYLQKVEIFNLLQNYDIIVAKTVYLWKSSMKEVFYTFICAEAVDCAMAYLKQIFEESNEKDRQAFEFVFKSNVQFQCNMMIMKKSIYDEYCCWLFPKILKLLEKMKIKDEWDNYSKRIIGFITEALFTVWIVQQKYSIYERPIKFLGEFSTHGKNE